MRAFLCLVSLLAVAGCSGGQDDAANDDGALAPGLFAAVDGTGGVCVEPDNAGFVFMQEDSRNCMAQGHFAQDPDGLVFIPRGDGQCEIPVARDGDTLTFGDGGPSCSYYCASGLELSGRRAQRTDSLEPLQDAAGDLIC